MKRLLLCVLMFTNGSVSDPFAVRRNVARTVNSQQMYEYILHCLKTTFKYFAQSLNTPAANHKRGLKGGYVQGANAKALNDESVCLSDFSNLSIHSKYASQSKSVENGPEDSDCIIEEEEEIEEFSDSDEEREKEKLDLGKSSLSEDEDDEDEQDEDINIDVDMHNRDHLDSFTIEDEEIFLVDEISGEELLSDEEGPDLDTPGSMDEEEEEEVDLAPVSVSQIKDETPENKNEKQSRPSYEFTKQAFTRGKVSLPSLVISYWQHLQLCNLIKQRTHKILKLYGKDLGYK